MLKTFEAGTDCRMVDCTSNGSGSTSNGFDGCDRQNDAIEWLFSSHGEQEKLCDMLEQIADSLPDDVDPLLCARVVKVLRDELPVHHRDEEHGLFPLVEHRAKPEDNVEELIAQLCLEHATDESFAIEVMDELATLSEGKKPRNPNMLGYMLRGFFESYRRHLQWEDKVLLPLARKRLTEADLTKLAGFLRQNRADGHS